MPPHLSFVGEAETELGLTEDADGSLNLAAAPARSLPPTRPARASGPFLRRQGQPLYSSKYRNDSSLPSRESAGPGHGEWLTRKG